MDIARSDLTWLGTRKRIQKDMNDLEKKECIGFYSAESKRKFRQRRRYLTNATCKLSADK